MSKIGNIPAIGIFSVIIHGYCKIGIGLITLIFCFGHGAFAVSEADRLKLQASTSASDSLETLLVLAGKYYADDAENAVRYARQAIKLAQKTRKSEKELTAHYHLVSALTTLHEFDEALAINQKTIELANSSQNEVMLTKATNQKGIILRMQNQLDEALALFELTLAMCNNLLEQDEENKEFVSMQITCMNNIGTVYLLQAKIDTALITYQELLRIIPADDLQNQLYVQGNLAYIYNKTGDYAKAFEATSMVIDLAKKLDQPTNIAMALNQMGSINYNIGRYNEALRYFFESLTTSKAVGNPTLIARSYNNIAAVYEKAGKYDSAIIHFLESAKIKEELDNKKGIANTYGNIGQVYTNWGQNHKAIEYYRKSLQLSSSLNDLSGIAVQYKNLGQCYLDMTQPDSAIFYLSKALTIADTIQDVMLKINALFGLGDAWELKQDKNKAIEYYRNGIEIAETINASYWLASGNIVLGRIAIDNNQPEKALQYLKKSLDFGTQSNSYNIITESCLYLSKTYEMTGHHDKALHYHKLHTAKKDSVFNIEKANIITEWQTRYEVEKKENENRLLKSENLIQSLKIEKKNMTIWSMTIGIIVIIGLLTFVMVLYRKRTIAYKNLVAKNLELTRCDNEMLKQGKLMPESSANIEDTSDHPEKLKDLEIINRFNKYLAEEKPYLYSNISIEDISAALSTNRSYLSRAINSVYKKSFSTIINEMRVRTARQMLADKKFAHISLEGIGELSGYASRVVFYRNFKKITGLNPSYFRDSIKT